MEPSSSARFVHPVLLVTFLDVYCMYTNHSYTHHSGEKRGRERATPTEGLHSFMYGVEWKEVTNALIDLSCP